MVDITAAGDRHVMDDHVVRLELSERIRDELLAGSARVPPRRFGFGRVAPSYQPAHADEQSDRERPFNSIEDRQPVELALLHGHEVHEPGEHDGEYEQPTPGTAAGAKRP